MIRADIAIIGAGPGGYVAAIRATQLGAKVVCIEKQSIGGVCLNWGCVPTKALLHSAEVLATARSADACGISVGEPTFDWPKIQARKNKIVTQLTSNVARLMERAGVQTLMGEATFARSDTLSIQLDAGQETVVADKIIIATGSRPMQVPIPGLDGPNVIDSTGALSLDALPGSIGIIGGGAIGLEFASLFNTFGVNVTVIEMLPTLAPLVDRSIGEGLAWSLGNQGIDIRTSTRVTRLDHQGEECVISMQSADSEEQVTVDRVLAAIGRSPNIEGLGLEAIGIQPTRKGIQVDDRMRTVVPNVYAIGDVALDGPMLAHVASHQGIVAVEDALGHVARMDYTAVPSCIFTLPEAASVGLSEEQAREAGHDVQVGLFALANNGKALAMGETDGFVKIVSEAKHGAVLGVHIVGPHASDLILEGTMAISLEATLTEIEHTIHSHPTLGEAISEAAMAARGRAIHVPRS